MSAKAARAVRNDTQHGWHRPDQRDIFCDLYREQKPRLTRFFQRKIGSQADAEDMAQETLARFFRSAPVDTVAPVGYLVRIAQNLVRDRAGRNATLLDQKSIPFEDGSHETASIDPHREAETRESLAQWRAILHDLPPETLEIFILNRVEEYSYRAIAQQRAIPLWQVQKHMLKAIRHVTRKREERDE
jgi:RNA polymerase sigma factor (sigma-70 family)